VAAGDLKLAYAQFEELETFVRFGARLDEATRQVLEHGRRIRACLKQPAFAPVSVPAQITLLLALGEGLFDSLPLEKMPAAEQALYDAAATLPETICERFISANTLSDEDRQAVLDVVRQALLPFQPVADDAAIAAKEGAS
jgi:F-type H+-transporting ATPase subunit alpha